MSDDARTNALPLRARAVSVPPASATATPKTDSRSSGRRTAKRFANARDAQARTALSGIRVLSVSMACLCFLGLPLLVFVPGTANDKWITGLSVIIDGLAFATLFVRSSRDDEFRFEDGGLAYILVVAAAATGLVLGIGMTSAVTGLVTLGLLLFFLSSTPAYGLVAYVAFAVGHLVLAALVLGHVVSATGLGTLHEPPTAELVLSVVWVEAEYLACMGIGLLVNRMSLHVMGDLEQAIRAASARDALLREVRDELERAAKLGGPGRFSGQEIGSFLLGDVIGRGGMGEVYAASHVDDGAPAAVKLLKRDALADHDAVVRFEREARTVAKLRSPHVVAVFEVGGPDAPIPYIAMEQLEGQDLAGILRARGQLPAREALPLFREIALGLDVAHEAGIVHRDLKPNNVFLSARNGAQPTWKILDFGVSKLTTGEEPTLTRDQVVGTPQYMAPEQATGDHTVDRRVDVHALAAIAYRTITGRLAFGREEVAQVLLAVATEIPKDPRTFVDVSEDVALVLRIGLAKRPVDRFPSASSFAAAFAEALDHRLAPGWRDHGRRLLSVEPWGSKARAG